MSASLKNEVDDTDSGFRAELTGVALADLVQLECAARSNRAFRVRSGNEVGYLYFSGGHVVHAATESAIGEAAAVELLSWSDGSFEACALPVPQSPTIKRSYQHLLLMAAQTQDEIRRKKLVSFPKSMRAPGASVEAPRPEPRAPQQPATDFVRLDASGFVLTSKGDASALSQVVAYGARLGDLVGDHLGIGNVLALEVELGSARIFIHREPSGSVVGMNVMGEQEIAATRERVGL